MKLLCAQEVSAALGINIKAAYQIINKLNKELEKQGYLTIPHRVPEKYLNERFYS